MEIFDGISEAISYHNNIFAGKNVQMASFSDRTPFLHEMGHLHHQDTYKFWSEARDKTSEIYKDFKQRNIQSIAGEVSDYAKNDPLEFVAEVYAKCSKGQTFSDDVMALYKKYCGPALP